jgi:hypothetical protein
MSSEQYFLGGLDIDKVYIGLTDFMTYSCHPKTGRSGFGMVIFQTVFVQFLNGLGHHLELNI